MASLALPTVGTVLLRASPGENDTVVVLAGSRRSGLQPCYWLYGGFSTDQVARRILQLRFTPKDKQVYFLLSNHVRGP